MEVSDVEEMWKGWIYTPAAHGPSQDPTQDLLKFPKA